MWPASWIPHPSSFYCSDINLFLTGYAWCKLFNKSLLLFENNSRSLTLEEKYCCIYYNLKRQIKSQTSYSCKVFLLTWIFQYTGNFFFFFFGNKKTSESSISFHSLIIEFLWLWPSHSSNLRKVYAQARIQGVDQWN